MCAVVTLRADFGTKRPILFSRETSEILIIAGLPTWLTLRLVQACLLVADVAQPDETSAVCWCGDNIEIPCEQAEMPAPH